MSSAAIEERPAFRSYEQVRDEIVRRYSVADLVEQTDEDLARADELFYKADKEMRIATEGKVNGISCWTVISGREIYSVRRFKNFVWCSCRGFFFSKKMCKHLAMTAGVPCENCGESRARVGKLCYECDHAAHPFGKVSSTG